MGYSDALNFAGYNGSYSLSFSRQRDGYSRTFDNQLYLSLTVPLGKGTRAPTLSASTSHTTREGTSQLVGLTGSAGEGNEFSYSVTGGRGSGTRYGGGNVHYRAPYASVSASASGGSGQSQYSAGLSGAFVAHAGGITPTNDLGETSALVEARDARGARVTSGAGIRIGRSGYAVVPSLTPYTLNTISIDPKGIPLDVELQSTSRQIAPRANALVAVRFATTTGRSALITPRLPDGRALPFGTNVYDDNGASVGVIAQGSHLFVRGIPEAGVLTARWGSGTQDACSFAYRLPAEAQKDIGYARVEATCGSDALADEPSHPVPLASRPAASGGSGTVAMPPAEPRTPPWNIPSFLKETAQ